MVRSRGYRQGVGVAAPVLVLADQEKFIYLES